MKRTLLILLFLTAVSFRTMAQSGDTELNAYYIPFDGNQTQSPYIYTSTCNTTTYTNQFFDGPNNIGTIANDVFYKINLPGTYVVTATTTSTLSTMLWLYNRSGNQVHVIANGNGATGISATLSSGLYYLVSEGLYSNGNITTTISFERPGDSQVTAIDAGAFSQSMDYHDNRSTRSYTNQYSGQSTKDVFYKFTLTNGMIVTLTHEGSSVTDTYMHLLNSAGTRIAYNDDYSGVGHCSNIYNSYIRTYLEPGTYYVVSEGYSADGYIRTNITGVLPPVGDSRENAINAGTYSSAFTYRDTLVTGRYSNRYTGRATNDVFHKLVLSRAMNVTFTHDGSGLKNTYMTLLNSSGTVMTTNNDYSGESHCTSTGQSFIQRQLAAGTYYVVSEGYSSEGKITLNITGCTSTEYGYSSIPSTYSTKSGPVGAMGGTLGVSPTGGATYTIPIKVPAGVGGLQPQLAIVYNSQAGNGVAGYGTSLSGLSSITRGAKDIYHDGSARGMTYGADDALYLDGVRLILVSGTAGQDGAIYSPESDPFTQVTVHGSCTSTSNSIWYEVQTGDGMRYRFGYDDNSRLSYTKGTSGRIHSWYVCRAEQPTGNYMSYTYQKESNCIYLNRIEYGDRTGTLPHRVEFAYENRDDAIPIRFDGIQGTMSKRLHSVTAKTSGTVFRTYTLNYNDTGDGSATKFSRLVSVTEKNADNETLPATTLDWEYLPAPTNDADDVSVQENPTINHRFVDGFEFANQCFIPADISNNGRTSIIGAAHVEIIGDGLRTHRTYVNIYESTVSSDGTISFSSGRLYNLEPEVVINNENRSGRGGISAIDFDGNGIKELLFPIYSRVGNQNQVAFRLLMQNDIQLFMTYDLSFEHGEMPKYSVGDLNNDGKDEIVYAESDGSNVTYHILSHNGGYNYRESHFVSSGLSYPTQLYVADMNGNGTADILVIHNNGYIVYWNQGSGIFSDANKSTGTNLHHNWKVEAGDFNGDGLLDFLTSITGSSSWYFYINNGDGTFAEMQACTLPLYDESFTERDDDKFHCDVFDFDGDGKSDVVITKADYTEMHNTFMGIEYGDPWGEFDKTYTYWMRSTGNSLVEVRHASSGNDFDAYTGKFVTGDFDGDGHVELMNYGYDCSYGTSTNTQWRMYRTAAMTAQSGKVTSVTGDFGAVTDITYASLADPTVYTRGTAESYPAPRYTLPLTVVKQTVQNNGAAGSQTVQYSYEGLKVHLQGRGMLGFSKTTAANTTLGVTVQSGVSQWNSTYYIPSVTYTNTTAGSETSQKITTFTIADKGAGKYFAYPSQTVETDMDGNTVTTFRSVDTTNGSVTGDSVSYGPGIYRSVSYRDYIKKGGAYHPQTVVSSQYNTLEGSVPFSSTVKYTYNDNGQVTQTIENYGTSKPLTTTYTYNLWGNLLSETVSGSGVPQLTTSYTYDATHRFPVRIYTSPASSVRKYTYDTWGNVLTERDSINTVIENTVTHTYDNWGNLIRTQIPGSGTVAYTRGWGSDGRYFVLEQGTARPWVKTWYDGLGRETLVESVGSKDIAVKKRTTYNTKGQVSNVENTQGNLVTSTAYTYDNRGRVLSETAGSGASVQYQYGNRTVTETSAGRTRYTRYDVLGNVKEVTDPVSTVNYFYSTNGQLRRVVTEDCIYQFGYDEIGNKMSYSDPDAGTTTYTYDALGRETGHTDARNVHFTTNYDVFGRITSQTAGDETITYTYGTTGTGQMRLVSKTLGAWSDTYEYDQYGRLVSLEAGGHTATYQYNSAGLLTKKTWGDSSNGKYVNYTYDTYGNHISSNAISGAIIWNLTQNTGTTTASTMKLNSNPTLYTRTVTADSYGYPASYFLNRGNNPVGGEIYTYNYSTGNLTQCVKEFHTETYSYDDADRLVTFNVDNSEVMSMTYSSGGNLLSKTGVGDYTYGSGTHKVINVDNTDDVIPYSSQSITYNAWGKVAEVNETIGSDTYKYELTYGPDLQRVLAVLWKNNTIVHLVNYGEGYEEKYQTTQTTRYYYVDGADGNSAVYTSNTQTGDKVYCIDRDHLGSVTALFDQNGNKCFSASFDPWGRRYVEQGSIEYDRGYTGHEHIDELGLIDMNGRMYDPILGRFISVDPYIQAPYNPQNFNRYAYCLNNPVRYTDPDGESWLLATGIAAFLLFTNAGYDIQKTISPVALHVDLHIGTHQIGVGYDVSIGAPTSGPISYRNHYGETYFWKTYGDNSGWEYRQGGEWGLKGLVLGFPYDITYSGTKFSGINDQIVNSVSLSKSPLHKTTYENDTQMYLSLPGVPKYDGNDRYRSAAVSIERGMFNLQLNIHTGMYIGIDGKATGPDDVRHFIGGDIDKQHHGVLSLDIGPFSLGWDSEGIRHTFQNRLAHDWLWRYNYGDKYPWVLKNEKKGRFFFYLGTRTGNTLW